MVVSKRVAGSLAAVLITFMATSANALVVNLVERAYQLDNVFSESSLSVFFLLPAGVDESGLNLTTGLGTVTTTITGVGAHTFDMFVDYDIDAVDNNFFNELGEAVNLADKDSRLSWESDEPGFLFGDIFANVIDSTLDNSAFGSAEDVSLALGFDFDLLDGETAIIMMSLTTTAPSAGFYLRQFDPDSIAKGLGGPNEVFFSGSIAINGPVEVPEPGTLALGGLGLVLVLLARRRRGLQRA